jgi:hypothetical protein
VRYRITNLTSPDENTDAASATWGDLDTVEAALARAAEHGERLYIRPAPPELTDCPG